MELQHERDTPNPFRISTPQRPQLAPSGNCGAHQSLIHHSPQRRYTVPALPRQRNPRLPERHVQRPRRRTARRTPQHGNGPSTTDRAGRVAGQSCFGKSRAAHRLAGRFVKQSTLKPKEVVVMERYRPVTGIDCTVASLLIDTEAPLDVLHETATDRIRAATQLLENLAFEEGAYSELARVLVISLREGCDLLDVVGRRLQTQVAI